MRSLSTGLTVILSRGDDRAILTSLGAIDALGRSCRRSGRVAERSACPRQLLLPPGQAAGDAEAAACGRSRKAAPRSRWTRTGIRTRHGTAGSWLCFPLLDYLFVNEQEARLIGRADDALAAARALASKARRSWSSSAPRAVCWSQARRRPGAGARSGGRSTPPGPVTASMLGSSDGLLAGWEPSALPRARMCLRLAVRLESRASMANRRLTKHCASVLECAA